MNCLTLGNFEPVSKAAAKSVGGGGGGGYTCTDVSCPTFAQGSSIEVRYTYRWYPM